MDPEQERLEGKLPVRRDHDLAIDDATLRQARLQRVGELGKVAIERLEVTTLDQDLVAVAEDDRPEAVPLRLEQPAVALRNAVAHLGEHRLERWIERKLHGPSIPGHAMRCR